MKAQALKGHATHAIFQRMQTWITLFIHSYNRLLYCKFTFYHSFLSWMLLKTCWILRHLWFLGLILRAHSMLLGFYYILKVWVPWKHYRDQTIWFILCLLMFELLSGIYMLLVDATLDGEMPRGFYIFKLNLTQLFKMFFY